VVLNNSPFIADEVPLISLYFAFFILNLIFFVVYCASLFRYYFLTGYYGIVIQHLIGLALLLNAASAGFAAYSFSIANQLGYDETTWDYSR
jgi:hypothetical protein